VVIPRPQYLDYLIQRRNNGLVKIITGIRRCGKSYLLFNLFVQYLIDNGFSDDHIIRIELDRKTHMVYRSAEAIIQYVDSRITDDSEYCLLIDEVQFLEDFEAVLSDFMRIPNLDCYITGSNSRFLSTDIATEFRGRGDQIRVTPLSFIEFSSAFDGSRDDAWEEYMMYGGLPHILKEKSDEDKARYLITLFDEIYTRDIIDRYGIRDEESLGDILNILSSSIGSLTNPRRISNTFKSKARKIVSEPTIASYLTYLQEAFIINRAQRYDIKGRRYIDTPSKYFFSDIGLRNARIRFRQHEENHIMENILYNDLCRRGYSVDVGVVEVRQQVEGERKAIQLEVDFVATKGNRKYYLQSALAIDSEEKLNQEVASLKHVGDSFGKILVVGRKRKPLYNDDGILVLGIIDFLLDDTILP